MIITDINDLPPADAEQAHLVDEISHPGDYAAFHALAQRCSESRQPMPEAARNVYPVGAGCLVPQYEREP